MDLWQDFQSHKLCYQRAMANSEMVKMLMKYVEANRDAATQQDNEIKLEIDSLPPNIQYEVKQFQERTSEGIEEFRKRALFRIQELVQSFACLECNFFSQVNCMLSYFHYMQDHLSYV